MHLMYCMYMATVIQFPTPRPESPEPNAPAVARGVVPMAKQARKPLSLRVAVSVVNSRRGPVVILRQY